MAQRPYPIIDRQRCTGCHLCVDLCPTDALGQIGGKADLVYPELCTYCSVCEDRCPEGAIALPFLIVFPTKPNGALSSSPRDKGVNQ